jgi:hypothetical protein
MSQRIIFFLVIAVVLSFAKKVQLKQNFSGESTFDRQIAELRALPEFNCNARSGDDKLACYG